MVLTGVADLVSGERHSDVQQFQPERVTLRTDRLEVRASTASLGGSFEEQAGLRAQVGDGASIDVSLRPSAPVLHNCGTGSFRS